MVNIILISHGVFCEGLLSSLKMIAGDEFGVRAVPLFPGETVDVSVKSWGKHWMRQPERMERWFLQTS